MKKSFSLLAAGALAGWMTMGTAQAQEPAPTPTPAPEPMKGSAPEVMKGSLITASAKVEKVDRDKHEIMLKTDKGKPFTISVPESVTRLENVKPGDKIDVAFYESIAVSLNKPGETPVGVRKEVVTEKMPGEMPGGVTAERVTATAKIAKIAKDEVTIKAPDNTMHTIQLKDSENRAAIKKLKVGDEIEATFTTALATSVTPKKAM